MTAIGETAVGVTEVRNDLKLWTIINIGSTIILWWSLLCMNYNVWYLIIALYVWCVLCNAWCIKSDVWCEMYNFWCMIFTYDMWCVMMCYVWCLMFDVWWVMLMCDVWCFYVGFMMCVTGYMCLKYCLIIYI